MFTGLVETTGRVVGRTIAGGGLRLSIAAPAILSDARVGDSIAINGCCLTVIDVQCESGAFAVEAGDETLRRTNLGLLKIDSHVNLERSLRLVDRLGGHFVTGHIDCVGKVLERTPHDDWVDMRFEIPSPWHRQIVPKGSVSVDGVSLTVVDVMEGSFSVALIPHTLRETTLGNARVADLVNLETDILAKYVERALATSP